jgi:hypothetical protein
MELVFMTRLPFRVLSNIAAHGRRRRDRFGIRLITRRRKLIDFRRL